MKNHDFLVKNFFYKLYLFLKWLFIDLSLKDKTFREYGVTIFCGRQGAGKTLSMVYYLEQMRRNYPECLIVTNFGYQNENYSFDDWTQFYTIRNGVKGVIFAIDEIQNEWSSEKWQTFPEQLLGEITQQRKQRIKIICSSQSYGRVVKQIREQCFEVVECFCLAGRWVFLKSFDAFEYNHVIDNPEKKMKLHRNWRKNYIACNYLRSLYDSYKKVERMKNTVFVRQQNVR